MRNLYVKIYTIAMLLVSFDAAVCANVEERTFMAYDSSNGLADNSVQIVKCTKTGRIMITTIGHVNFFDGASFAHIDPKVSDAVALPGYEGSYQIYFDHFHHLWMKNNRMMSCVNLTTEKFVRDVYQEVRKMGMTQQVDDIFGDNGNYVWFRSGQTVYCQELNKQFSLHSTDALHDVDVYRDSLMMMFHADGVVSVSDFKSGRHLYEDDALNDADAEIYTQPSALILSGSHYYQLRNADDRSVLLSYDVRQRKWTRILEKPFLMNSLCEWENRLYIGTSCGYIVYDPATGENTHFENLRLTKGRTQVPNINSLAFDRQGGMWIGTNSRGLLYSKNFPSPFHSYSIDAPEAQNYIRQLDRSKACQTENLPRKVNCVFIDSRGWRWTGTNTGLIMEHSDAPRRVFNRRDGMPNEVVHSVAEDNNHDIWIGTSYGISHLFIRGDSVYHLEPYINQDNIPVESFLNGRAMTLKDGTIIMQTTDHIVAFNPDIFQGSKFGEMVLMPKLISLRVDGMLVEPNVPLDGRVIMNCAASRCWGFTVNYDHNTLLMTFLALNYLRPVQTYYRIRIKGVPRYNDWRVLSYGKSDGMVDKYGLLRLLLVDLPPGKYELEMQVSLWPHTWPQEPFVWGITVDQPWWRTTGLYLTLSFLILVLLVANLYYFNRNTRLRMLCNNEESDILHRIKSFAARCKSMSDDVLVPVAEQQSGDGGGKGMSKDFVKAMLSIVPYVNTHQHESFSMDRLAIVAGMEKTELFGHLSSHIDLSPRELMLHLHLQEAARLLATTDMKIEEIADQCRFATVNYFISSFYHQYRKTPKDYRNSMLR